MEKQSQDPYTAPNSRLRSEEGLPPRRGYKEIVVDVVKGIAILIVRGTPTAVVLGSLFSWASETWQWPRQATLLELVGDTRVLAGILAIFYLPSAVVIGAFAGLARTWLRQHPVGLALAFGVLTFLFQILLLANATGFQPTALPKTLLIGATSAIATSSMLLLFARKRPVADS
jgi:hypothetical protein